ncbi:MAG: hypothetical protein ACLPN5_18015 [Roseiarcus sp.]
MTVKSFLRISSAIGVLFGLGFLLAPESVGAIYGTPPEVHTILTGRYFGATLLTLGLVFWLVKDMSDKVAMRGLLIGFAIGNVIGVVISIVGTVAGTVNSMGWTSVALYLVLLAGCAYYLTGDRTGAGA